MSAEEEADLTDGDEAFGRGYASARMWQQYSKGHQGVCLAFHRDAFDEQVRGELSARTPLRTPVNGVHAHRAGRRAWRGKFRSRGFPEGRNREGGGHRLAAHYRELYFLKLLDWESEHEYRYVALTPGEDYEFIDIGDSLAAVFLGHRLPPWQRDGAARLAREAWAVKLKWSMNGPLTAVVEASGLVTPK